VVKNGQVGAGLMEQQYFNIELTRKTYKFLKKK
jgi:hypothetical protein